MTTIRPRVIGMLGGMSWESTAHYYRYANEMVRDRLGGLHSARLVMASVDFAEIEAMQTSGRWQEAGEVLAQLAAQLQQAGAECILICANTMHKVADQVEAAIDIPLIHLADATAQAVQAAGLSRVALLGTAFTMEQRFYLDRLEASGLQVSVPGAEDRARVHRIIFDELVRGEILGESRDFYRAVIERQVADGAQGVILGCTEIEMLISQDDSPVPVFPTAKLHVQAAVDWSLQG